MSKIQAQGVHHITFVGSNRETTIDFYSNVLGMPLVFEQPNLDVPDETHLYFDPGDGRLITFFVRPTRTDDATPNPQGIGNLHHLAFTANFKFFIRFATSSNRWPGRGLSQATISAFHRRWMPALIKSFIRS